MREQAWELRTLLPDLPGESEVASCRLPGPSGAVEDLRGELSVLCLFYSDTPIAEPCS